MEDHGNCGGDADNRYWKFHNNGISKLDNPIQSNMQALRIHHFVSIIVVFLPLTVACIDFHVPCSFYEVFLVSALLIKFNLRDHIIQGHVNCIFN